MWKPAEIATKMFRGYFEKPLMPLCVVFLTYALLIGASLLPLPSFVFLVFFALLGVEFLLLVAATLVMFIRRRGRDGGFFLMVLIFVFFATPFVLFLSFGLSSARIMFAESVSSSELPVAPDVETALIDFFAKVAETALSNAGDDFSSITLRSLEYVNDGKKWRVNVDYYADTRQGGGEWQSLNFIVEDGNLRHFSGGAWYSNKKLRDALEKCVRKVFREYGVLLPRMGPAGPIIADVHAEFAAAAENFMTVFQKTLPVYCDAPGNGDNTELSEIVYRRDVKRGDAEVEVNFRILKKSDLSLRFIYDKGKFKYVDGGVSSWNAENIHVMDAANSACDAAVDIWLDKEMDGVVCYARPPSKAKWSKAVGELPEGLARMTFIRRGAHPFLAEYYRKIKLSLPSGLVKTFRLPMNTGGRTNVRVFLVDREGERYIRFRDHANLDTLVRLRDLRLVNPSGFPDGRFVGAFMGITTRLRYIGVDSPDAEKLFSAAAARGYELSLKSFKKFAGIDSPSIKRPKRLWR